MNLKGARLEEEARTYLAQQGYFAVRSAAYLFEGVEVTDLDVWAYGRHGAGTRVRAMVDAKSRKSPKALERIVWAKGMKSVLRLDHVFVATADQEPRIADFARLNGVKLLPKYFLEKAVSTQDPRLALEEFESLLDANPLARSEGWWKVIENAKSAMVSTGGFAAFNRCSAAFKYFIQRLMLNPKAADTATRAALLMAAYAAICLDSELSKYTFESTERRFSKIASGVRFGDSLGAKFESTAQSVLAIISERMENGKVIAAQANAVLAGAFASVRSEIIAEFFSKENNQVNLFRVARELEAQAHAILAEKVAVYSVEQKQFLGLLLDFLELPRPVLLSTRAAEARVNAVESEAAIPAIAKEEVEDAKTRRAKSKRKTPAPPQGDLL